MAAAGVAVAVTNEKNKALAALTSAALALPGLQANAAIPIAQAEANFQYGHYQESDNRMSVDVYHADFIVPIADRLELGFSIDRDTYSGATPAYSVPVSMTNQTRLEYGVPISADIVSAASGGISAGGLTILGGLNTFQQFRDIYDPGKALIDTELDKTQTTLSNAATQQYLVQNPKPPGFSVIQVPQNVTINFDSMTAPAYGGAPNLAASGNCVGCYLEQGFLFGIVGDGVATNHIHQEINGFDGTNFLYQASYHNDSSGIYIRSLDGGAFDVKSTDFKAPFGFASGNVRTGAWEILGFSQPDNPTLSSGDGTNYPTKTAYQTVNNTVTDSTNGTLNLNSTFQKIKGLWIHFQGAPNTTTASSGLPFKMGLDNLNLVFYKEIISGSPDAVAWQAAFDEFDSNLNASLDERFTTLNTQLTRLITIEAYRAVLNQITPPMSAIVQRYQEQPLETRTMPTFSGKYYFDDTTLAFSGGMSEEPDFLSNFGSVNVSHEMNNKLTTVSAGYNISSNQITRTTDHHGTAVEHVHGNNDNSPNYPELNDTSIFNGFNLGISQVLTKNTLFQSTANYTNQSGYLSNPYKFVYIRGEVTPEEYYIIEQASSGAPIDWNSITQLEMVGLELFREVRPESRNLFSISNRINQHIPSLDASAHIDYRYFIDDWGINSHTLELKWFQSLPMGITITPNFRYYSQSQADFFAPYFLSPRSDGYYSSDFRLADFGSLTGGITFSKQFTKGITVDAGFEYNTRQSGLKLGGGQDNSYADYSYYLVHANLNVNLSALNSQSNEHQGHHMHHNHGAPLPAGVMYGHMMNTPGELMVGYRYMYANQTGDIWHDSHAVNEASLLHIACGSNECASRPNEMSMNMHMLDLMYAPTDWLNLMLMPQIMDMNMSLSEVPGSTVENEHGSGHSSGGLGDTIMAGIIKVYDEPDHHVHLGLGVSAPTGDTEVTIDGLDSSTSELQDYGMQLGSGTWDFRPSLTYTGQFEEWSWGAQLSGIKRMQNENRVGYALGDAFQSTAWSSYKVLNWLSTSLRGIYSEQGAIKGQFNRPHSVSSTVDYPSNYGGRFWDLGFGLNVTIPDGPLTGHNISLEWVQPIADDFKGYQLEREGSLNVTWTYGF